VWFACQDAVEGNAALAIELWQKLQVSLA